VLGMTGVGDDSRGRLLGRPWLVVGFTLAIGATLALVLSDDLRWLRLGIIAALWAAVIGGFLAVNYRKHAAHSEDAVAEAQAVYELELEREIAARREYELEIAAESRERAEADSRDELDALRAEVIALRDSLQSLFGGEVLLERVALTAQATRMRSVGEDHRLVGSSESKAKPAQLPAGKRPADNPDPRTELMDRVPAPAKAADKRHKVVQQNQTASQTTQYSPVTPVTPIRIKPEENGKPVRRPQADVAARVVKQAPDRPVPDRADATRRQQAPVEQRPQRPAERPAAERRQPAAAPQPSQAMPAPVKPPQPAPSNAASVANRKTEQVERKPELARPAAASYTPPVRKPEPVEEAPFRAPEPEWEPAWTNGHRDRPASDLGAAFAGRQDLPPVAAPEAANARHGSHRSDDGLSAPTPEVSRSSAQSVAPEPVVAKDTPSDSASGGGRRRRADDAPAEAPASGGRRRRPDGEPPAWEADEPAAHGSRHANGSNGSSRPSNGSSPVPPSNGSHSRADSGSNGTNGSNGHRSAAAHANRYSEPEPAAEAGSHAAGRSVTELLAAHGASETTPRRRRRAED
jgi:hypothetical protein